MSAPPIVPPLPPCDLGNEITYLSSLILYPECVSDAVSTIRADDFYLPLHRKLFGIIASLHTQDEPINIVTVKREIERRGLNTIDLFGERSEDVAATLAKFTLGAQSQDLMTFYARAIREKAARRRMIQLAERLRDAVNDPTATIEETIGAAREELESVTTSDNESAGPVMICLADVEPRRVDWQWPGRIAQGRITVFSGVPGLGKSFTVADIAARVSTGINWPDGSPCPQGSVILITGEDDPHDTIRPRLDAHHADVNRIHLLSSVRRLNDKGKRAEMMFTLADVGALELALQAHPDCRLVVVDPLGSFIGGKTDTDKDNAVRAVLAPVARLAQEHGAAVLLVCHTRKSTATLADDTVLGSRGFTGIARTVLHLMRDTNDRTRRLLLPGKNNLSAEVPGLAFRIFGDPPAVAWEADPVDMSADEHLAAEAQANRQKPGPEAEERDAASVWLKSALVNGPRLAKEIEDEAKEGEGISKATLRRAKDAAGIEAYRPVNPGPWWWRLGGRAHAQVPRASATPCEKPEHLEHVPAKGQECGFTGGQDSTEEQVLKFLTHEGVEGETAEYWDR